MVGIVIAGALLGGTARAQQLPGTLLAPDQVDPTLTQAVSQYAGELGYAYVGDCGTAAPGDGQLCSEVFQLEDGSTEVWLLDATNSVVADQFAALSAGAWSVADVTVAAPSLSAPPAPSSTAAPALQGAPAGAPAPSSGAAGPINVSATLSTQTCSGGTVRITVLVTDANQHGVASATVTGYVAYKTTGHDLSFPATDATGHTSTSVDTGRPRGGYNVVWTVDASAGGYTAHTSTTCYAP